MSRDDVADDRQASRRSDREPTVCTVDGASRLDRCRRRRQSPGTSRAMSRLRLRWVEKAAAQDARLVVLPELFLPGYDPQTLASKADQVDVDSI